MAVAGKMKNARALFDSALKELRESKKDPEKIRDASEKAWGATAIAIDALIEAKTGERVIKGKSRTKILIELAEDKKVIPIDIQARFFSREDTLHGDCFYNGLCEPRSEIERRIKETELLLDDVQKLIEEETENK